MTYDLFSYNGEEDILEIRFNLLSPFVDKFVIVENTETFSGNPKILHWAERSDRFEEWENKVIYHVVQDYSDLEINLQLEARKDYVNEIHFQRAFYQKESLRKALEALKPNDEDIIFYGDVDEIPTLQAPDDKVYKLRQLNYCYYLNNRSSEDWRGTVVTRYKNVRNGCLNDMRAKPKNILDNGGWHFTNMGGVDVLRNKIESYDHQEVNIPWVKDGLEARMEANVDFLGRTQDFQGKPFTLWKDESELPSYLLENKEKYAHLWKS